MAYPAERTKAILLVGGLGTRLRTVVPSTPKPLALLGDRPFLELLIRQLSNQGIRRLVLCTGYLASEIERELGDGRAAFGLLAHPRIVGQALFKRRPGLQKLPWPF